MGERRKSGGKEKCKLLNQERKDTARLKPQRPGRRSGSCQSSQGKTKRKMRACPCKKAFFDSLNYPLHRIAAHLRFRVNSKGLGWAANGDRARWT
jgi:hypothetical protein